MVSLRLRISHFNSSERTEISELPKTKLVIYVFKSFQNLDLQLLALILSEC